MRRDLHPLAWWAWAIGLAAYASGLANPWLLLLVIGVAGLVVAARRGDQPWSRSFRIYVVMGAVIVLVRVLFRILLGGTAGHVLIDLPQIPLPGWVLGIRLLGPLTREALLAGLYDGLRLAAIVIAVGAANSLANPKRLLRSIPSALLSSRNAFTSAAVGSRPQRSSVTRRMKVASSHTGDGLRPSFFHFATASSSTLLFGVKFGIDASGGPCGTMALNTATKPMCRAMTAASPRSLPAFTSASASTAATTSRLLKNSLWRVTSRVEPSEYSATTASC